MNEDSDNLSEQHTHFEMKNVQLNQKRSTKLQRVSTDQQDSKFSLQHRETRPIFEEENKHNEGGVKARNSHNIDQ